MASFDPVNAFVAFVSFIVGFACARVLAKKDEYSPAKFNSRRAGKSAGYVSLEDRNAPNTEQVASAQNIQEKQGKFDSLFNYKSDEKSRNIEPYAYDAENNGAGQKRYHSRGKTSENGDTRYVEIRSPVQGPAADKNVSPVSGGQKKEQKEEWTPMGFFED